jgi:hypothetical protein
MGAAAALVVVLVTAGCGDDAPTASPTSVAPPVTTAPATSSTMLALSPTSTTIPAGSRPTVVDDFLRGGLETDRYTYELTFPKVQGLADATVQDTVNAEIRAEMTAAVDEFVTAAKEFPAPPPNLADQRSGLTGTYEVSRLDDRLASFRVRLSTYLAGAAHPAAASRTYNYDLASGKRLALADLFTAGSAYLQTLSELSRQLLATQPGFADLQSFVQPGTEPTAGNFDGWTLTDQDLVVTFDEYQVAPYAMGMPHVSIPFASLRLLLDPAGPLAIYN